MLLIGFVTLSAVRVSGGPSCPSRPAGSSGWRPRKCSRTSRSSWALSGARRRSARLTMPAASHLAIHFASFGATSRGRSSGRRTLGLVGRLDPDLLVRGHRGDRLRCPGHQRRRPDSSVRRDPGHMYAPGGLARDDPFTHRDTPPILEILVRYGSSSWVSWGAATRLTERPGRHPARSSSSWSSCPARRGHDEIATSRTTSTCSARDLRGPRLPRGGSRVWEASAWSS